MGAGFIHALEKVRCSDGGTQKYSLHIESFNFFFFFKD